MGQTLPSDSRSANDCSRRVSGSPSVGSRAAAERRKRSGHRDTEVDPFPTFSRYFSAKPSRYSSGIPARRRPLIKVVSNKARTFGTPKVPTARMRAMLE